MKMKSTPLALLVIGLITIVAITPIHATYTVKAYMRTDKSSYLPGDTGTLFVTLKNLIPSQSFTVRNITVNYPWMAFITDHWDGNFTVTGINAPVGTPGGTWNAQYGFTVPTDGRAYQNGDIVNITIGTDVPLPGPALIEASATIFIAIASYQPVGVANLIPIVSLVLLVAAVAMLVLVFFVVRRMPKK